MSLGRYVSDLETGDVLAPVEYVMTPFVVREYCHGTGEHREEFHRAAGEQPQLVPPTLAHIDKIRLLHANCPGGAGPDARIHYEFATKQHAITPVGKRLVASAQVSRRYEKKDRTYLEIQIEVRVKDTRQLLVTYTDTAILAFTPKP